MGFVLSRARLFLRSDAGTVLQQEKEDELLTKMEGKPQAREDVNELRARIETGVEAALEIPESQVITAINRIWPVRLSCPLQICSHAVWMDCVAAAGWLPMYEIFVACTVCAG